MKWNHFITIILLNPYFKINGWIYRGILGVLVKVIYNFLWIIKKNIKFENYSFSFKQTFSNLIFSDTIQNTEKCN